MRFLIIVFGGVKYIPKFFFSFESIFFTKNENLANLIDIGFDDEHKVDKYGFTIYKSTPRPNIGFIYMCSFGHKFTMKA